MNKLMKEIVEELFNLPKAELENLLKEEEQSQLTEQLRNAFVEEKGKSPLTFCKVVQKNLEGELIWGGELPNVPRVGESILIEGKLYCVNSVMWDLKGGATLVVRLSSNTFI